MKEKQNLADIIQMYHQAKARQLSTQSDGNSLTAYPEYILPYLVHALAQHSCPNIDECKDVKAFELIYRYIYFFSFFSLSFLFFFLFFFFKFLNF
jgi:sister-chromatid-cohesion protein PDS5